MLASSVVGGHSDLGPVEKSRWLMVLGREKVATPGNYITENTCTSVPFLVVVTQESLHVIKNACGLLLQGPSVFRCGVITWHFLPSKDCVGFFMICLLE